MEIFAVLTIADVILDFTFSFIFNLKVLQFLEKRKEKKKTARMTHTCLNVSLHLQEVYWVGYNINKEKRKDK